MMDIVKNGMPCAGIVVEQNPVVLFAGEELQKYISRISDCQLPLLTKAESGMALIWIGSVKWLNSVLPFEYNPEDMRYDGFCMKTIKNGLMLASHIERGLLFAVYALLEYVGCRWYYPGENGEFIPSLNDISVGELYQLDNPDFEIRSFTEGSLKEPLDIWLSEMLELVDWCGKSKINSVFIHENPLKEIEGLKTIVSEIKKRGMVFEYGGHGIHQCVDRSLFDHEPSLFRMKNGMRLKDGNFCASNDKAVRMLVDGAVGALDRLPEIDVLHLFFDDSYGGSWCECGNCISIPPVQQQMNVINQIGRELKHRHPGVMTSMVLYHDTIEAEKISTDPEGNVFGYFAPRERCYSHRIGDVTCLRNTIYYKQLIETVKKFKSNTYAFEYYNDIILFRKMKMHLPHIIMGDLKDYKKAGINKITSLLFGRYSWWAYEWNMHVFARAAWNVEYDDTDEFKDYCKKTLPGMENQLTEYYKMMKQAAEGILCFCEYMDNFTDLRDIPPQALIFYEKHIYRIKNSVETLEHCISILQCLIEKSNHEKRNRLIQEKLVLEISFHEACAIYHEMLGRYHYQKSGQIDRKPLETNLAESINHIHETINLIKQIPYSIKGNAGGEILFIKDISESQIEFLESLIYLGEQSNDKCT